jgi:predicted MFS family arabinose efflux permease
MNPIKPQGHVHLWRNRDYMLLWSGQVVSVLGSSVSSIIVPLLILALTNSPAAAGIGGALTAIPYVLFSLPAGALIDRWDRKKVMVLCDLGRSIAFASIPIAMWFDVITIWQLYVVAFVEGTLFVFFNIAEVAALPRVVPKEQLGDATAQNMSTFGVAGMIGPGLGGFLFQSVGRAVPFVLDAFSYLASALSLLFIKTNFQGERAPAERRLRAEIMEGLRWAWNEPLVRVTSFISGGMNLTWAASVLIIIVLAKQMGAGEAAIGTIFSIGSVGGIVGAALGGRINRRFTIGQIVVGTTWVNVLLFPVYALAPNIITLGLISAVLYTVLPIYSVAVLSYRLALIPDALQGRVNSAVRLVAFGGIPLGSTLGGFLLEQIGAVNSIWVFSAFLLALGIIVLLKPVKASDNVVSMEQAA